MRPRAFTIQPGESPAVAMTRLYQHIRDTAPANAELSSALEKANVRIKSLNTRVERLTAENAHLRKLLEADMLAEELCVIREYVMKLNHPGEWVNYLESLRYLSRYIGSLTPHWKPDAHRKARVQAIKTGQHLRLVK